MAHLFKTNPRFSTRYLLTTRSPLNFTLRCVDIALRFAILGRVDEAVEILEMADEYIPLASRYVYNPGLYFAFQTADWWPDFTPDEDMHDEHLLRRLEVGTVAMSYGHLSLDHATDGESLERDLIQLRRVIGFLTSSGDGNQERHFLFVEDDSDEEGERRGDIKLTLPFDSAVIYGLHLALKLEDQAALGILVEIVREDMERFVGRLAKNRFMWQAWVKGILGPEDEEGKAEITAEFERIKSVIRTRLRNGVEYPFLDHSMLDLVKMLDANTIRHDDDDESCTYSRRIIDGKPSIRNPGASQKAIEELEDRLGEFGLPDDYIEFLEISDGMEGIWNGWYRQRLLAPSTNVENGINTPGFQRDDLHPEHFSFSLIPYAELPDTFDIFWPNLRMESCVLISEGEREKFLWLVKGDVMRRAWRKLVKKLEGLGDGGTDRMERRTIERVVGDFFGGMEEFEEEWGVGKGDEKGDEEQGWGVVYWEKGVEPVEVWGSFREWIEGAVVGSEFPDVVMERKDVKI